MNKLIAGVLMLVVAGGLLFWVFTGGEDSADPAVTDQDRNSDDESLVSAVPVPGSDVDEAIVASEDETVSAVVTFADGKFDPAFIGPLSTGSTVRFINESTGVVWVASDDHPAHLDLPAFDAKSGIPAGESYEYTFDEPGDWTYHDHLQPWLIGTIQVTGL